MHSAGDKIIPQKEFIDYYPADKIKAFILYLVDQVSPETIQQCDIVRACSTQFKRGASDANIRNKLQELTEERGLLFPKLFMDQTPTRKSYYIPDLIDMMFPWHIKVGLMGNIIIIAIITILSYLYPNIGTDSISFGDGTAEQPVIIHQDSMIYGYILAATMATLWSILFVTWLRERGWRKDENKERFK